MTKNANYDFKQFTFHNLQSKLNILIILAILIVLIILPEKSICEVVLKIFLTSAFKCQYRAYPTWGKRLL